MEEFKGTPAPWRVDDQDPTFHGVASDTYHQIKAGAGYLVGGENKGFGLSGVMSIHDANLIAAAPELLDALQDFMANASGEAESCGHSFECVCRFDKAKAAIAKALGK